MRRILLHLAAVAVLLPLLLIVSDSLVSNFAGILYLVWVAFFASRTTLGRKFLLRYYHEVLRLENMM